MNQRPELQHDFKAEQAVIGCLVNAANVNDSDCLDSIFDSIQEEVFFTPAFQSIFRTAKAMRDAREPIDAELVVRRCKVERAAVVILEATHEAATPAHVESYIKIVVDAACQRAVVLTATDAIAAAKSSNPASALAILRSGLESMVQSEQSELTTAAEATEDYLHFLSTDARALPRTAIPELDYALGGGVDFGEMVILAARPSHGKSAIALQSAHNWTEDGLPVLYVTLEMSAKALGKRITQYSSDVPEERWRMDMQDLRHDLEAYHDQREPIYITDKLRTLEAIVREVDRSVRQRGVRAVVIDYAQLIQGSPGKSRYESITHISTVLRGLATEHNIIMLVLCQLSREIDSRKTFVPNRINQGVIDQHKASGLAGGEMEAVRRAMDAITAFGAQGKITSDDTKRAATPLDAGAAAFHKAFPKLTADLDGLKALGSQMQTAGGNALGNLGDIGAAIGGALGDSMKDLSGPVAEMFKGEKQPEFKASFEGLQDSFRRIQSAAASGGPGDKDRKQLAAAEGTHQKTSETVTTLKEVKEVLTSTLNKLTASTAATWG